MSHTQSALNIANYFIYKSWETGDELTPMKLIKMVYIAHGWHLVAYNEPLINEAVEAWKYGPVISNLYQKVKRYRSSRITSYIEASDEGEKYTPRIKEHDEVLKLFLDKVWDAYSKYNGLQLSTLTHRRGTAWYQVWHESGKGQDSVIIPETVIKDHYQKDLVKAQAAA